MTNSSSAWLHAAGISLNRERQALSEHDLDNTLSALASGSDTATRIANFRRDVFQARLVNQSEERAAGHWALRQMAEFDGPSELPARFAPQGRDLIPEMKATHQRMVRFVEAIQRDEIRSTSGLPYRKIVHLGIGGSDLGPQLLIQALGEPATDGQATSGLSASFLSNLDYHATDHCLRSLNPAETLVIVASKSWSTQETMSNADHLLAWMSAANIPKPKNNLVGITSHPEKAMAWGIPPSACFDFDQSVGGRYSIWGPVSLVARLVLSNTLVDEFLSGGLAMDHHFYTAPLSHNLPAVMAATDFYNLHHRRLPTLMVSAYDSRLGLLVPYLKQLWMESLGKHVDRNGSPLQGPSCPILWGDVGTNAQHAFFQLLHQGAQGVAIELIGTLTPEHQDRRSHQALLANLIAQAQALSTGNPDADPQKSCWGGHPLSVVMLDRLDARQLGALLALWEHRVLCLAAINNINPFDQWGVELGKQISKEVLLEFKTPNSNQSMLDRASKDLIRWVLSKSRDT